MGYLQQADPSERHRVEEGKFLRAPSWFQLFLGIDGSIVPERFHVHHIIVDEWAHYDELGGTIYFSMPTVLDPTLAPEGKHIVHAFVTAETWQWDKYSREGGQYNRAKEEYAASIIARIERILPGLSKAVELSVSATPLTMNAI